MSYKAQAIEKLKLLLGDAVGYLKEFEEKEETISLFDLVGGAGSV